LKPRKRKRKRNSHPHAKREEGSRDAAAVVPAAIVVVVVVIRSSLSRSHSVSRRCRSARVVTRTGVEGWSLCPPSRCRCCLPPLLVVPVLVGPRFHPTSSCSRRRLGVMWQWPSCPRRPLVVVLSHGRGAGSSQSSLSVCRCSCRSLHPPRKQRLAAAVPPHPHPRFVVVVRPVGRRPCCRLSGGPCRLSVPSSSNRPPREQWLAAVVAGVDPSGFTCFVESSDVARIWG
jgi:hypothetical protein